MQRESDRLNVANRHFVSVTGKDFVLHAPFHRRTHVVFSGSARENFADDLRLVVLARLRLALFPLELGHYVRHARASYAADPHRQPFSTALLDFNEWHFEAPLSACLWRSRSAPSPFDR